MYERHIKHESYKNSIYIAFGLQHISNGFLYMVYIYMTAAFCQEETMFMV